MVEFAPESGSVSIILSAIVEKLKNKAKGDFKGRYFEAWLIMQAVSWYLRYPLSYRDLERPTSKCAARRKRGRKYLMA